MYFSGFSFLTFPSKLLLSILLLICSIKGWNAKFQGLLSHGSDFIPLAFIFPEFPYVAVSWSVNCSHVVEDRKMLRLFLSGSVWFHFLRFRYLLFRNLFHGINHQLLPEYRVKRLSDPGLLRTRSGLLSLHSFILVFWFSLSFLFYSLSHVFRPPSLISWVIDLCACCQRSDFLTAYFGAPSRSVQSCLRFSFQFDALGHLLVCDCLVFLLSFHSSPTSPFVFHLPSFLALVVCQFCSESVGNTLSYALQKCFCWRNEKLKQNCRVRSRSWMQVECTKIGSGRRSSNGRGWVKN
jgi:hypothetical protein